MLVVSRKPNERITFPNLNISVEVLRVAGKAVRIGVDAPSDVRILRGELVDEQQIQEENEAARRARHAHRNRLHTAKLSLHLLQKQLDAGRFEEAEQSLASALEAFAELDQVASSQLKLAAPATPPTAKKPAIARRALVVEDNANERELLAGYLRLCGYEVDTVGDGQSAMDFLASHERPDVVLLDMQMPRMDGRETISAIRCDPSFRDLKLFAVSGMDQETMRVPTGDRGVNRWFSKPLNPTEFAHQLEAEIMSSRRAC